MAYIIDKSLYSPNISYKSNINTTTNNVGGITTLNGAITANATTITLTSATEFPSSGSARVVSGNGTEYFTCTGISTNDLTGITRGAFNTSAVSHTSGSTVTGVYIGNSELSNEPDVMVSCKSNTSGTLFFDFSNDDTLWDTFPVSGFIVSANC